jgi:phage terminase large subunit GpA-like protein
MTPKIKKCCGVKPVGREIYYSSDFEVDGWRYYLECPKCGRRSETCFGREEAINSMNNGDSCDNWADDYQTEEE